MNETYSTLYEEFVERYFETGSGEVPAAWPAELRERCLFFLKVLEEEAAAPGTSILSVLAEEGVVAGLSLSCPEVRPPEDLSAGSERYVIEREIGRGGMGRVLLAYDRDLRRRIAMKVLRGEGAMPARTSRFLEEAQATSQLEHPNIGPVYDVGLDPARTPFFTMKWIRGRNLEEILRSGSGEFSQIRLLQILQQAAMGVDFAHSRGVIHRDLKPQNIMVGDYGEVLVVDWGLAKISRRVEPAAAEPISTSRREDGVATLDGTVQGSIPYMAPEQARGDVAEIDARTDVFGLGAILYRILTGSPPYPERDLDAALARARKGGVTPPAQAGGGRFIPPELDDICRKALSPGREDRYRSARDLHDALQRHVEGIHDAERRAREAGRLLEDSARVRGELRSAEAEAARLDREVDELRAVLPDHAPEEEKASLWALVERARAAKERASDLFRGGTAGCHAVLSIDPAHGPARSALAELYAERMTEAEARGDLEAAKLYEDLVKQYPSPGVEVIEEGLIRLDTEPSGATALLSRHEEKGLLLVASEPSILGTTPIERPLPRSSYLVRFRKAGYAEARYPFLVDRRPLHEGRVRLHEEGSIPRGFVQVAAGESILGGKPDLLSSLPRERRFIAEFFAAEFPATLEEYCAFLNARQAEAPRDDPSLRDLVPSFGKEEYAVRGPEGSFQPEARLHPRTPVMGLLLSSLAAYCAWLGRKLRRRVRLLDEREWERCARGADGRLYPWGNGFDWAFTKGGRSRPGEPFPEPVGSFPRDVSPFGVRDLAGCVREVCAGRDQEGYGPCRGGSWLNPYPVVFRADARLYSFARRATDIGFRVGFTCEEAP